MPRPRLVIAGASGPIGRHLIAHAAPRYDITVLTRGVKHPYPASVSAQVWRPDAARSGDESALSKVTSALEGADCLVNLAGATLADGRLQGAHLRRVIGSRIDATTTLTTALQRARRPPVVLIQASATGIYGSRGDEVLTEASSVDAASRLGVVCSAWESAAAPATARSRVCITRFGIILTKDSPVWRRMKRLVQLGIGGPLGTGDQWMAWIDADDVAAAILFLIENEACEGVYNVVAPEPVRQSELARQTGLVSHRPNAVRIPAFALRILLGSLANATILQSARATPERLLEAGFRFRIPTTKLLLAKLLSED